MPSDLSSALFVVLGNQLFPPGLLRAYRECRFFMAEDVGLCTYVRHHQQKIVLFLAAMRAYRDVLRAQRFRVHYEALDEPAVAAAPASYEVKLGRYIASQGISRLLMWEIEDKFFERRMQEFAEERGLSLRFLSSPMFLTTREAFAEWLGRRRPHLATFYPWQRRRLGVLIDAEGGPVGGRWSFDDENRQALPRGQPIPRPPRAPATGHVRDVIRLVGRRFADHPGELSEAGWWLPTTRRQALDWLRRFLEERFDLFGPYEDALSTRDPVLFHSALSPALNLGLLTPREVLDRALAHALEHGTRLNSLEGFVRQLIGWREFVRGIYQHFSEAQEKTNFFGHVRRLRPCWYEGTTGLPPLDFVIRKARRFGWVHHIERLMVAGNLLTLCEVEPAEAYRWFMEMFVDSADWVMGPNVYGMGIHSDGGVFSTKPYICGSNYLRKMGEDRRAPGDGRLPGDSMSWYDTLDGLYWRFVDRHRGFMARQARMATAVSTLDRIAPDRRRRLFAAADAFLAGVTI